LAEFDAFDDAGIVADAAAKDAILVGNLREPEVFGLAIVSYGCFDLE
jgi:hypothetical protein